MKNIINGKKYDTEKSTLIARWDNWEYGAGIDETNYRSLYKDADGEYFVAGEGGANTVWSHSTPTGTVGGERILAGEVMYHYYGDWIASILGAEEEA